MSLATAFPTRLHMRPLKTLISLRIRCTPENAYDSWQLTECAVKTLIRLRGCKFLLNFLNKKVKREKKNCNVISYETLL